MINFFKKLLGLLKPATAETTPNAGAATIADASATSAKPAAGVDPAKDKNLISAHDQYGREVFFTKQQWRESILPDQIKKVWNDSNGLAQVVSQSLNDGFIAEVLEPAQHLATIDLEPERGHVLLAITYLQLHRYNDAEKTLNRFFKKYGESGVTLTNLAKVYSGRGDDARSLQTLWRALLLDPNQENGLGWYAVIHSDKGGPVARIEALHRVAAVPHAWLARLWLARDRLEQRDLPAALALYDEAVKQAPRPLPASFLIQLSGDLGNNAHLPEILQLAEPHFDVAFHGLPVGNNLIKAHLDLGQLDAARLLVDRHYALNRPDWTKTLSFWDNEIAKARVATADAPVGDSMEATVLSLAGPVWLPPTSPALELFPAKPSDATLVAFLGSSAEREEAESPAGVHLSDAPGRLSRAIPLFLAEQTEFLTNATTRTLIPWLVKPSRGFILASKPWDDSDAANHARANSEKPADYVVTTHVIGRSEPWIIDVRLVRTIDAVCLADASLPCPMNDPSEALGQIARELVERLFPEAEITTQDPTPDYQPPIAARNSLYLFRLEQLLAVRVAGLDKSASTLNGERDIITGQLELCLDEPTSIPVRLLLAHSLRGIKKVRPEVIPEFRGRVDLLQKQHPLAEPAHSVITRIMSEAFAG